MALSVLSLGLILWGALRSRRSTLLAPLLWSLATLVAITYLGHARQSLTAMHPPLNPWEFTLCCLAFCPIVSVMGAKRPQDLGWNFVVLALWGVIAFPAMVTYVLHPEQRLIVGPIRGGMLWILIFLTPINYIPTRFWLAAILTAFAQFLLLGEYLPGGKSLHAAVSRDGVALGTLLLASVPLLTALLVPRENWRFSSKPLGLNATWIRFRDEFGLFWGLRFAERVNQAAEQAALSVWLSWSGFRLRETGELLKESTQNESINKGFGVLRTAMHGMLRRFWSKDEVAIALKDPNSHE